MMTDDEIISVVQAHKDGKKIQHRDNLAQEPRWRDVESSNGPSWSFHSRDYRVAPEPRKPRELWLIRDGQNKWAEFPCKQSYCDKEQIHVQVIE